MHKKSARWKLLLFYSLICLLITGVSVQQSHQIAHLQMTESAALHVTEIDKDIEFIFERIYILEALVLGADGETVDLNQVVPMLRRDDVDRFLCRVFVAPGGVVSQVYPREGNEGMLGVNVYASDYPSSPDAIRARDTNSLVISAPFEISTGETVIAGRLGVDLPQPDGSLQEWGIVSVSVRFPEMFSNLRNDVLSERGYAYRILLVNDQLGTAEQIYSHQFDDLNHMVQQDFYIGSNHLRLQVAPLGSWFSLRDTLIFLLKTCVIAYILGCLSELGLRRLRKLWLGATMDEMTGLLNRASGQKRIEHIIHSKAFVSGAFLIMDIDNFKNVNDTMGHQKGDEVLAECAQKVKKLFRGDDILCRLGGDEFIIFLPYKGERNFLDAKLNMLLHMMRRTVSCEDERVNISASIGIALAPEHGDTFKDLYRKADLALYCSKEMGRDRATIYDECLPPPAQIPARWHT